MDFGMQITRLYFNNVLTFTTNESFFFIRITFFGLLLCDRFPICHND